jgi:hypothetical protein
VLETLRFVDVGRGGYGGAPHARRGPVPGGGHVERGTVPCDSACAFNTGCGIHCLSSKPSAQVVERMVELEVSLVQSGGPHHDAVYVVSPGTLSASAHRQGRAGSAVSVSL